jgi:hypothetical protein
MNAEGRGNSDRFAPSPGGRTAGKRAIAGAVETNAAYRRLGRSKRPMTLLTGCGLSVRGRYFEQIQSSFKHVPRSL